MTNILLLKTCMLVYECPKEETVALGETLFIGERWLGSKNRDYFKKIKSKWVFN